jgi:hypothetical protein
MKRMEIFLFDKFVNYSRIASVGYEMSTTILRAQQDALTQYKVWVMLMHAVRLDLIFVCVTNLFTLKPSSLKSKAIP